MPKVKISEYSATANSNTDVASINIDEGCAPSGINNAIRAVMGHLKDFQQGTNGDPFNGPVNGTLGATTASTANVTTLTTSSTVTHNGGTANGVAYLNGSKVLTTGSALVFDGTNLRVGTTSSLSVADKLTVVGGNFAVQRTSGITTFMGDNTVDGYAGTATNHAFALLTNSIERARIDSSGNLGLGVTPSAWAGFKAIQVNQGCLASNQFSAGNLQTFFGSNVTFDGSAYRYIVSGSAAARYAQNENDHLWFTAPSGTAGNAISFTQAMTLDASGNLLVGKTSSNNGTNGAQLSPTTQFFTNTNDYIALFNRKGTDGVSIYFQKDETNVGNISVTTSATAYNTSSDYRLKNTIAPMTGALAKVALLKPCTYKWNADGSDGQGFIAHELAEVVPQCVTGEKDAVDADGKPQYQGIDTSFLVATLTAAIQEQQALITQLTARITALESA